MRSHNRSKLPQTCCKERFSGRSRTVYTSDVPRFPNTKVALDADSLSPLVAVQKIQNHISSIEKYLRGWKLTVNPTKSSLVVFPSFRAILAWTTSRSCLLPPSSITALHSTSDDRKTVVVARQIFPILIDPDITRSNRLYKAVLQPILYYGALMVLRSDAKQMIEAGPDNGEVTKIRDLHIILKNGICKGFCR